MVLELESEADLRRQPARPAGFHTRQQEVGRRILDRRAVERQRLETRLDEELGQGDQLVAPLVLSKVRPKDLFTVRRGLVLTRHGGSGEVCRRGLLQRPQLGGKRRDCLLQFLRLRLGLAESAGRARPPSYRDPGREPSLRPERLRSPNRQAEP